ncbi:MAG TPA: glycoside hydrolase family 2 protein [Streptosporangiaceae bacterium]|nr:glycoside hydrolase family 2 protein [Streptosporangiaceae bacterium]
MFIPSTFRAIGEGWTLRPVSGPGAGLLSAGPIAAAIPGEVHLDLLRAGLIADPFDGDNEAAQQWIGDTGWRYEARFEWHAGNAERHDLVAYGLDTAAEIELNGSLVARSENQHRSYRFDVRDLLVEGENTLSVTFAAPVPETLARAGRWGTLPHARHHEYNQLRKMACSFGWDWGIDVAGAGIWKPIGIDSWSGVRIASVRPLVDIADGAGVLTAHVEIERADGTGDAPVEVGVAVGGAPAKAVVPAGSAQVAVVVTVPSVELWWPVGHGAQPLYDVDVSAGDARWSGRVGFRTVRVDTAPDAAGNPFKLHVNGELVLVRGVNWIPDHAFLTLADRDRYARGLRDAVEANVNLIRVWGGGIYESDDLYEFADEQGLLVWQDFLFACAAYAEEEHMRAEVEAEAREQIARLSPHPSLVIWNGNNENIWGWADWGWRDKVGTRAEGRGMWGEGYYQQLLPALLAELDPTRFYSPASPYSFGDYLHPNDPRNGTTHIWDVWNTKDYTVYHDYRPRFVSEFGFQGPPAWSTLTSVVHDTPLEPYGHQMLVHQKANRGNEKLQRGQAGHLPASAVVEHWHWATQLNQAHAIRFGVEYFRSLTPHNTGTILWQLNDNWPVISWAAVDFDGHRKPAWYALKAAYAPRLATLQPWPSQAAIDAAFDGVPPAADRIALVLVNDTAQDFAGSIRVERQDFGGSILASAIITAEVPARGAASYELPARVAEFGDVAGELIIACAEDGSGFGAAILDGADVVRQRLDPDPLTASAAHVDGGYEVTVTARSYARDVFLQADRVDPAASVDRGLVSLPAGQTAVFRIASQAEAEPDAFLRTWALSSANALLAAQCVSPDAGLQTR